MSANVLIIGASGDIGLAIAKHLAKSHYHLILHYNKNKKNIDEIRKSLAEDQILMEVQADLREESNIRGLLDRIVYPIDFIVFASGASNFGLFQEATHETMEEMLALHIKAPWKITQHFLPHMIRKKFGKIVLITSIWGSVGASYEVIYSTVKGAQNTFVKALAKEIGPSNVQINAVSPGFIDTKMNGHLLDEERNQIISDIPLNRAGTPQDVANMVGYLLSDAASYVQGQVFEVNGGW